MSAASSHRFANLSFSRFTGTVTLTAALVAATCPRRRDLGMMYGFNAHSLAASGVSRSSGASRCSSLRPFVWQALQRPGDAAASQLPLQDSQCNTDFLVQVHYRAAPTIRGSGKERGHGQELERCPLCDAKLMPGKHHIQCAGAQMRAKQVRFCCRRACLWWPCGPINTSTRRRSAKRCDVCSAQWNACEAQWLPQALAHSPGFSRRTRAKRYRCAQRIAPRLVSIQARWPWTACH